MERSLGATFFLIASVAFALAFGAWWLDRVAFSPDATVDSAAAILEDPDIRQELISLIAPLTANRLDTNSTDLAGMLETKVLTNRLGAREIAPIIHQAHQIIIGDHADPIRITGAQLVPIVRDERAADVDTFTLPIEKIGTLATFDSIGKWIMLGGAALGAVMLALGLVTRPERREFINGLGELMIAFACAVLLFGYAIPVHLFTAIDNRTWTGAIPPLALRTLPVVIGTAAVLSLAGAFLILTARSGGGSRKQWSTPVSMGRYRGGENPGWG
ncbi:MAG TPA: hypothetical protein VNQ73_13915 [Ilumatobacter sp.]|nr:hypothetical protein [Ilumatobacter sp.]